MISACLGASDASFDHFFKVLSARFLCCKVTIFPFVSNACLMGRHLEMMHIFGLSLYFCLPVLAPIDAVCLQ